MIKATKRNNKGMTNDRSGASLLNILSAVVGSTTVESWKDFSALMNNALRMFGCIEAQNDSVGNL